MLDGSSHLGQPKTVLFATDDAATDEETICHRCRQVDWDGLPALAETLPPRQGTETFERMNIRTIEADREQLTLDTLQCKICRILWSLKPPGNPPAWIVQAQALLDYGSIGPLELKGKRGEKVTALYGQPTYDKDHYEPSCLVAIKRNECGSGSEMIVPESIDYKRLQHLMQECMESHSHYCNRGPSSRLSGLKVIDISSRTVIEAPRGCQYIALSYVWGKENAGAQEMGLQRPPPLIEDAVSVTSFMGFRYLWIDRYCIPQNDDQERHRLISRMDQVYSSASITIIDASGQDSKSGLPVVSHFPRRSQQRVHIGNTTLLELPHGEAEIETSRWATRGWTYQEGFLSPRRLIFTRTQVLYLCASKYAVESAYCLLGQDNLAFSILTHKKSFLISPESEKNIRFPQPYIVEQLWEYSKRDLTYPHDSLNAFLGVLNFYTQRSNLLTPEIFHVSWGMFAQYISKDELLVHLNWCHESLANRRPHFPSWTWAGWGGPLLCRNLGITLRRHGEGPWSLDRLGWQVSGGSNDQKPLNIWDLADQVRRCWPPNASHVSGETSFMTRLHITCLIVPVAFKEVSLTIDESERKTEIHYGNGTGQSVVSVNRAHERLPEETTAVLQVWEGVYIAAEARLDQAPDIHNSIIGLVYSEKPPPDLIRGVKFGCVLARHLDGDLYERVGVIPHIEVLDIYGYVKYPWFYQNFLGGVFMDETGIILDKIRVSEREWDSPFEYVGKRRTVILV